MATRSSFSLNGADALNKALKALGQEVATKAGAQATRKAANVMRDAVKERAPYDPGDTDRVWRNKDGSQGQGDYGHLRDNIKTRKKRAKQTHTVSFEVSTGSAFWGRFSEFGTEHEPARPWFRPALDAVAGEIVEALQDELKKSVERAAKKVAK